MVPANARHGRGKLGADICPACPPARPLEFFIHAPKIGGVQKPWASINDWMHAMNVNRFKGNDLKKYYTGIAAEYAHEAALQAGWKTPDVRVDLRIVWHEVNARRDPDNIMGGIKFVLDGIVKAGLIHDDSQKHIRGIHHDDIVIDKQDPGAMVTIVPIYKEEQ